MSTRYSNDSTPILTRYSGSAALLGAIRAAASLAPEIAPESEFPGRYRAGHYPFTAPAEFVIGSEFLVGPRTETGRELVLSEGAACYWPEFGRHAEAPGPFLPLPADRRVTFHFQSDGSRGSMTVANVRADLLRLADKVHSNRAVFDGKVKKSRCPVACAGSKGSAPHVAARALWSEGDYAGAIALAQNVGSVFVGAGSKPGEQGHVYMRAESVDVAGHAFVIGRSINSGKFRVAHVDSGLSVNPSRLDADPCGYGDSGFVSHSAALDWVETAAQCDAWRDKLDTAIAQAAPLDQCAALAHYLGGSAEDPAQDVAQAIPAAAAPAFAQEAASVAPAPVSADHAREAREIVESFYDHYLSGAPGCTVPSETIEARARHLRGSAIGYRLGVNPAGAVPYDEAARMLEKHTSAKRAPAAPVSHVRHVGAEEFDARAAELQARAASDAAARDAIRAPGTLAEKLARADVARAEHAQGMPPRPIDHSTVGPMNSDRADGQPPTRETTNLNAKRAAATLDKMIRCDGAIMTRREFVALKIGEGLRPTVGREDRIQPMTRMQFFRATNEEQRAHDARINAAGQKYVFYLGGFEITKTEYEHALTIVPADPVPAKPEALPRPCDRPMAGPGLTSYRARSPYGWIMIGARDDVDAMREAVRSTPEPTDLQVWDGRAYVPCGAPGTDTPHVPLIDGPKFRRIQDGPAVESESTPTGELKAAQPASIPRGMEMHGRQLCEFKALRLGDVFQLETGGPVFVRARCGFRPGCGGQLHACNPRAPVIRYTAPKSERGLTLLRTFATDEADESAARAVPAGDIDAARVYGADEWASWLRAPAAVPVSPTRELQPVATDVLPEWHVNRYRHPDAPQMDTCGPVYRVGCMTAAVMVEITGGSVYSGVEFGSPQNLFRQLPQYRTGAARALRAQVATRVRADRAIGRAKCAAPTRESEPARTRLELLALIGTDRSCCADDDRELTRAGLIRTARDGWIDLTQAGRLALTEAGYTWRMPWGWKLTGKPWADCEEPHTEAAADPGRVRLILHNVLVPLQNAAPDGVPTVSGLEGEANRIEASADSMADYADPQGVANYREVARDLRELASVERARLAPNQAEKSVLIAMRYREIAAHLREKADTGCGDLGYRLAARFEAMADRPDPLALLPDPAPPPGKCDHPPRRLFAGYAMQADGQTGQWVACCDCGEVLRGGATLNEAEQHDEDERDPGYAAILAANRMEVIGATPGDAAARAGMMQHEADLYDRAARRKDSTITARLAGVYLAVSATLGDAAEQAQRDAEKDDETIPAPLDGLDVSELTGAEAMAEFERASMPVNPPGVADHTPQVSTIPGRGSRRIQTGPRGGSKPALWIPPGDLRGRIPARFAPCYVLQA